jgi:hypothetical protein
MKPVVEAAEEEEEEAAASQQQQQQHQKCSNSIRKICKTRAAVLMAPLMKVRCSRLSTYRGSKSGVITNGLELIKNIKHNVMYITLLLITIRCLLSFLFFFFLFATSRFDWPITPKTHMKLSSLPQK